MELPGIDPRAIPDVIERVPEEHSERPDKTIEDPATRVRIGAPEYIEERWGTDSFQWDQNWYYLPYDVIARVFSEQEILRLWIGSAICSEVGKYIEENRRLLDRLNNCLWQYGYSRKHNVLADMMEGLKRLHVGLPDFEVRLTYSWGKYNTHAYSEHVEGLYLDAMFGLLLFYKGQHVLTCAFAPSERGVLVAQIQLRTKKKNRFLYKLGCHYQDFCLDILGRAFGFDKLWLVEGESAVAAIHNAYGKEDCPLTAEDDTRIATFYNRPLSHFTRDTEDTVQQGRKYLRLHHKEAAARAA